MQNPLEKRKSRRRPVLDSFSVFVVIPNKAPYRLPTRDLSDLGIGFQLDPDGLSTGPTNVQVGESLDISLYLNQTLHVPLRVEIVRIFTQEAGGPRLAGARISEPYSAGYRAFTSFVQLLDALADLHE
ncbi:hypothetical protein EBZ37_06075 [bacterium]|nr:hypothetical protein [bacterium]